MTYQAFLREMKRYVHITIHTQDIISALLTSPQIWKQPKYTSTSEYINNYGIFLQGIPHSNGRGWVATKKK